MFYVRHTKLKNFHYELITVLQFQFYLVNRFDISVDIRPYFVHTIISMVVMIHAFIPTHRIAVL